MANIVSKPPLMIPIFDRSGMLNKAWSIWFRDIYNRVAYKGGNAIDDNLAFIDEINFNIDLINTKINQNVQDIIVNADAIAVLQPDPRTVVTDTAAEQYEFLSVTCSTVDITVTLPDATLTPGVSIWIHKVDSTAFKVLTSVKDLFFQGTTLHLVSNGTDWIPS